MGLKMKKLVLSLAAVAAFSGSALAADLPARTYTKAPVMPQQVYNWTGFYLFGGGGYGLWESDSTTTSRTTGLCVQCVGERLGGKGYFGTVGAGYDWQFGGPWVIGVLADGQFGSIKGTIQDPSTPFSVGQEKLQTTWAVGARIGYLVAPNVLSYVNGGYTGSHWSGTDLVNGNTGAPIGQGWHSEGFDRNGWFVGGGVENSLNIFGVSAPGWFMKTEYRLAEFDNANIVQLNNATGNPVGNLISFKPIVQTVSTSIVYRFNWGGMPSSSHY